MVSDFGKKDKGIMTPEVFPRRFGALLETEMKRGIKGADNLDTYTTNP